MLEFTIGLTLAFTEDRVYKKKVTDYGEEKFEREYRSRKTDLNYWCALLQNDLKSSGHRNCDVTVNQKVLLNLEILTS